MRVVITGGLGHIGSRLIRDLISSNEDYEIDVVDDLRTQRYASCFGLPPRAGLTLFEDSVESLDLESLLKGAVAVIHLAANTDAANSFGRTAAFEEDNLGATQHVAKAALAAGVRLVFSSSTSVYGAQQNTVDESCKDLNPQSPYAQVKIKEEELLSNLASNGLAYTVLRLGTIFGHSQGMRFHTAVNRFCWDAANGKEVQVWRNSLDEVRPYLDVGDASRALIRAALGPDTPERTYNVVTKNATVREVLQAICDCGVDVRARLVDSPILNQTSYEVRAQRWEELGFTYEGDLRVGIKGTLSLLQGLLQRSEHSPGTISYLGSS